MKISVIIPAYNHEMYIHDAIESVLEQTFNDLELIIINDGSTDKTEDVILEYNDPRISYIAQSNRGAHATINRGIDLAKGDYIAILNSDDVYHANRMEKCLRYLEKNNNLSGVFTKVQGIDEEGMPVENKKTPNIQAWLKWYNDSQEFFRNNDFLSCMTAKNLLITTSNFFLKKSIFKKVGGFRRLRYAHDWDMLLRLSRHHALNFYDEILLEYRIHEKNTVQEDKSEKKVRFEVNWLIADHLRKLNEKKDVFELMKSLRQNHYISFEVLTILLMINKRDQFKCLLDFDNAMTQKIMELMH